MTATPAQNPDVPVAAPPPSRKGGRGMPRATRWARWWPWVGALLFATILAGLPLEEFKDRQNYLNYFTTAPVLLLTAFQQGPGALLANEPLFPALCILLNAALGDENGLRALIFLGAFLVSFQTLKVDPKSALVLIGILLLPQVLKNHVVHLRQGLGLGIFLLGWMSTRPRLRWVPMLCSPLVHSSFFFVLFLMGLAALARRTRMSKTTTLVMYAVTGIAVGLALGHLVRLAGARQGDEYEFVAARNISGLGFVFWSIPLALMMIQSRRFFGTHVLEIGTLVFYLATYFLSPFTGRVFESTLLLILLSGLKMKRSGRTGFYSVLFAYSLMQWVIIALGSNSVFSMPDD